MNNCANGCQGTSLVIPSGNTFYIAYQYHNEAGDEAPLPEGYDLIVGLYDSNGKLILDGSMAKKSITMSYVHDEKGVPHWIYKMKVTHDISVKLSGRVSIEITIASDDRRVVKHSRNDVTITTQHRRNNALL